MDSNGKKTAENITMDKHAATQNLLISPVGGSNAKADCNETISSSDGDLLDSVDTKDSPYKCKYCSKSFTRQNDMRNHIRKLHGKESNNAGTKKYDECADFDYVRDVCGGKYACPRCKVEFTSKKYRNNHYKKHFQAKRFVCVHCHKDFTRMVNKNMHEKKCNIRENAIQIGGGNFSNQESNADGQLYSHQQALGGVVRIERIDFANHTLRLLDRLIQALQQVQERMAIEQENTRPFKTYISLKVNFYKAANPDVITEPTPCFNSEPSVVYASSDLSSIMDVIQSNIMQQINNYERNGSGWVLYNLVNLDLHLLRMAF